MAHYKEFCPGELGIECDQKPYCKWVGSRAENWAHQDICRYKKYECERCEAIVIKMLSEDHDCYQSITNRM